MFFLIKKLCFISQALDSTIKLSESPKAKGIVIGSGEGGLPIILGNQ